MEKVDEADKYILEQLRRVDEKGVDPGLVGLHNINTYTKLRDEIKDYTDGNLIVSRWSWPEEAVTPGGSAGLCFAEYNEDPNATSNTYWSCWE